MNTEPQPLPTHYYGSLSVLTNDLAGHEYRAIIHDSAKNQQFKQILGGLEKIFVPYETE